MPAVSRPVDEWADLKYRPTGHVSHIVPFGDHRSLCSIESSEWHGTGDFEEIEKANDLPLCFMCRAGAETNPDDAITDVDWDEFYNTKEGELT